jgi:hypothetical protein
MFNNKLLSTLQNTATTTNYIGKPLVDLNLYLKTTMSLTTTLLLT